MISYFTRHKSQVSKIIAIYQILGGLIGLGFSLEGYFHLDAPLFLEICFYLISSLLYSYSVLCGLLIFKNVNLSLKCSLINQYLQLLSFAFAGYAYKYTAGIYVSIGLDTTLLKPLFNYGFSAWYFIWNTNNQLTYIDFNLFAFFIIFLLDKLRSKAATSQDN